MKMKKVVSGILVATQIVLGLSQVALAGESPVTSPEFKLIEQVIALQGEHRSKAELQKEMGEALAVYKDHASAEGQEQRLQSALVELGVMSPEQASVFTVANLPNLSQARFEGAQFSGCALIPITFLGSIGIGLTIELSDPNSATADAVANGFGYVALAAFAVGVMAELGGSC